MKLEGTSLKRDFLRFIGPSIAAQWVYALYTMVDGIFVAKGVSETALTAVNISMPFVMGLYSVSILFAIGTSTVTAILLGEKKQQRANQVFTQNIVLLTLFSIVLTAVIMLNLETIARFLGATELTLPYVMDYIGSIAPFSILLILSYSFETLIKTDGYPKKATLIVTAGALINVVLDYVMVMRLNMGISGAAIATGLAHVAIIIMYLSHFLGKNSTIKFARFRLDLPLVWREFKNGLPSGITELSTGVVIFLFNQAILRFLTQDALVSYSIISYVNSLTIYAMVGIAQGYQPLISYYYGQKRMDNCRKLFRYGIQAAAVLSVVFTGLCLLGAGGIVSLFVSGDMPQVREYSISVLRIFSLSFLIAGFNIVIGGYFTAVELPTASTVISLSRSLVLLAASLAVLTAVFGGPGIWWSPLLAEVLTLAITGAFLLHHRRRRREMPAS